MRPIIALLILLALAACQVTTSQGMGSGVTIRSSAPIGDDQATDGQTANEHDAEAKEDRMQDFTIGGGFSAGVGN